MITRKKVIWSSFKLNSSEKILLTLKVWPPGNVIEQIRHITFCLALGDQGKCSKYNCLGKQSFQRAMAHYQCQVHRKDSILNNHILHIF